MVVVPHLSGDCAIRCVCGAAFADTRKMQNKFQNDKTVLRFRQCLECAYYFHITWKRIGTHNAIVHASDVATCHTHTYKLHRERLGFVCHFIVAIFHLAARILFFSLGAHMISPFGWRMETPLGEQNVIASANEHTLDSPEFLTHRPVWVSVCVYLNQKHFSFDAISACVWLHNIVSYRRTI